MGKRHPNPRLVKIHRSYSVEEIAGLFGIHKNTIRAWLKQGLEPIDKSRPVLVHGKVLAAFLTARRAASKRPCPSGLSIACAAGAEAARRKYGRLRAVDGQHRQYFRHVPDLQQHDVSAHEQGAPGGVFGKNRMPVLGGVTTHKGEQRPLREL
jgi:transposase-like protein